MLSFHEPESSNNSRDYGAAAEMKFHSRVPEEPARRSARFKKPRTHTCPSSLSFSSARNRSPLPIFSSFRGENRPRQGYATREFTGKISSRDDIIPSSAPCLSLCRQFLQREKRKHLLDILFKPPHLVPTVGFVFSLLSLPFLVAFKRQAA